MFNFFRKKTIEIHEPLNLQIHDVKKSNPLVADLILKGLDCDIVPNSTGSFGSSTNPIPVNGSIGEIKYLGKLRGKTGHPFFFHRILSIKTNISEYPIDVFELVCNDGTQWCTLHFDCYHPRRSNKVPEGFTLMPYDQVLHMDIPYANGVTNFVENFPYGLPDAVTKFYGGTGVFARHIKENLEKCDFVKPSKIESNDKPQIEFQGKTYDRILRVKDIPNFDFITDLINQLFVIEKELISRYSDKTMGFSCPLFFNQLYTRHFMIERYLFIKSFLQFINYNTELEDMSIYVTNIASEVYEIEPKNAWIFHDERISFYKTELKMLKEFKYPHPGKIVYSLYHPSCNNLSHELDDKFDSNSIGGMFLLNAIMEFIGDEIDKIAINSN